MTKSARPRRTRVTTEIPGFDTVLGGGLLRGGIYVVRGAPGSGKTILGNQICFANARRGGRSAYVTLLAESHARMMLHLESLDFFDPGLVDGRVDYFSGYGALVNGGLRGVLDFIRGSFAPRSPAKRGSTKVSPEAGTIIVIDGFVALSEASTTVTDIKKFIHELQVYADMIGATVLLLAGPATSDSRPEYTMVDGIFELSENVHELRAFRELRVRKLRGVAHLHGGHFFHIGSGGIVVHPRVETVHGLEAAKDRAGDVRVSTGVDRLDAMLRGGLPHGSSTLVLGPSGAGKTTMGLHFLAASPKDEHALFFGFYESPSRIMEKARRLGLPLATRSARGRLEVMWQPSTEESVDAHVHRLLDAVSRTGATRLVIDGLDGLQRATMHAGRAHHVFAALGNELRARGVTTMYTYETMGLIGSSLESLQHGVSALAENLVSLRFVELRSALYRLIAILKVRDSDYDTSLREFRITSRGILVEDSFASAEAILTGTAVRGK